MISGAQDDPGTLLVMAKNKAAVALGRLRAASKTAPSMSEIGSAGGSLGGPARAKALTAKRRREIALKAAAARWEKQNDRRRTAGKD